MDAAASIDIIQLGDEKVDIKFLVSKPSDLSLRLWKLFFWIVVVVAIVVAIVVVFGVDKRDELLLTWKLSYKITKLDKDMCDNKEVKLNKEKMSNV